MSQQLFESPPPPIYAVMKLLPRNAISFLVGSLVRLRLPQFLARPTIGAFVRFFGINIEEAEKPVTDYATIEDIFTRRLRPGLRPAIGDVVSPADGMLTYSEAVTDGTALQVKGQRYSLVELVHGLAVEEPKWSAAWAMTVYLAPHNYHRVHVPVTGVLAHVRYLPGDLWPVNETFVRHVPRLFLKNERLVFHFRIAGGGTVDAVMVGAFNVGRMTTPFIPHFATNVPGRGIPQLITINQPVNAGDEMGTFLLGSTVVLVFDPVAAERFRFVQIASKRPIMTGQAIVTS